MSDTTSTLHWSSNNFDLAAVISSFYCSDRFLTNYSQAGNIEILFGVVGTGVYCQLGRIYSPEFKLCRIVFDVCFNQICLGIECDDKRSTETHFGG